DQPVVGVVDVAREIAQRVGLGEDVALLVVGVHGGQVQAGRIDLLKGAPPELVVGVLRHLRQGRAFPFGNRNYLAASVVGVGGADVQAGRIDDRADHLALQVELRLGDSAARIRNARVLPLGVVGVGGGEVQPSRINPAGKHAVGRVIRIEDVVAPRVHRFREPVGPVEYAGARLPQSIGHLGKV